MRRIKTLAGIGCSTLLLAGTVSLTGNGIATAVASSRVDAKAAKKALSEDRKADEALAKHKWADAVRHAESAVALNPTDAGHRETLGTAYLRAGRFASAHQAFADVLSLQPDNGHAALNLALAEIAEGKWDDARHVLADNQARIAPADRGLALALAGDPAAAIDVLTAATRSPEADAKTRQNLALAMALAGRWQEARVLVGLDMAPAEADARVAQWAVFAKPSGAADQVASLLGITPVNDPGQPISIALNAPVSVGARVADAIDRFMPGQQKEGDPAPAAAAAVEQVAAVPAPAAAPQPVAYRDVPVAVTSTAPAAVPVKVEAFFAPRVRPPVIAAAAPVRPAPAVRTIASPGAYKSAVKAAEKTLTVALAAKAAAPVAGKGSWYVQLGAYDSAGVARDGWKRATRRYPTLASYTPAGMNASVKGAAYYRLSVGGFARGDAAALCRSYRSKGGICFVRADAGDQMAAWHKPAATQVAKAAAAKKGVELASR